MTRLLNGVVKVSQRLIRFALATLLWAHTVFLFQIPSYKVDQLARTIHLSVAELLLFGLLIAFSYLAGTSFWSAVGNLVYIYCFPFVILFYLSKWFLKCFLAVGRWVNRDYLAVPAEAQQFEEAAPGMGIALVPSTAPAQPVETKSSARVWSFVLRPLRRFTLLWCILLVSATHRAICWLALIIVIIHGAICPRFDKNPRSVADICDAFGARHSAECRPVGCEACPSQRGHPRQPRYEGAAPDIAFF